MEKMFYEKETIMIEDEYDSYILSMANKVDMDNCFNMVERHIKNEGYGTHWLMLACAILDEIEKKTNLTHLTVISNAGVKEYLHKEYTKARVFNIAFMTLALKINKTDSSVTIGTSKVKSVFEKYHLEALIRVDELIDEYPPISEALDNLTQKLKNHIAER